MSEELPQHQYEWVKHRDRNQWSLHMWPFQLIIDLHPREALPYVGSLAGKVVTLSGHRAWATSEEAAKGMIEWGLEELSKSYHELAKLKGG